MMRWVQNKSCEATEKEWIQRNQAKTFNLYPSDFSTIIDTSLRNKNLDSNISIPRNNFLFFNFFYGHIPHRLRSVHWSHYIIRHTCTSVRKGIKLLLYSQMYYINTRKSTYFRIDIKILLLTSTVRSFQNGEKCNANDDTTCTHHNARKRADDRNDIKISANIIRPNQRRSRDADVHNLYMGHPAASKCHTTHSHIRHPRHRPINPCLRRFSWTDLLPFWI